MPSAGAQRPLNPVVGVKPLPGSGGGGKKGRASSRRRGGRRHLLRLRSRGGGVAAAPAAFLHWQHGRGFSGEGAEKRGLFGLTQAPLPPKGGGDPLPRPNSFSPGGRCSQPKGEGADELTPRFYVGRRRRPEQARRRRAARGAATRAILLVPLPSPDGNPSPHVARLGRASANLAMHLNRPAAERCPMRSDRTASPTPAVQRR